MIGNIIGEMVDDTMDLVEDATEIAESLGIVPPGTAAAVDAIDDTMEDVIEGMFE